MATRGIGDSLLSSSSVSIAVRRGYFVTPDPLCRYNERRHRRQAKQPIHNTEQFEMFCIQSFARYFA